MKKLLVLSLLLFSVFLPTVSAANTSGDCFTLFYSSTCPHCDTVEGFIDSQRSDHNFTVDKYEAGSNSEKFAEYVREYNVPSSQAGAVPAVFTEDNYAVGSKNAINLLNRTLDSNQSSACVSLDSKTVDSSKTAQNTSNSLGETGLIGISALALTDSINPCALAVLLILVGSIMSGNLENQRKAIKSGLAFTAGIFTTYLLMGVLLVAGIKGLQQAASIEFQSVYLFFGAFAVLIGLLNMKDYFSHGLGGFAMEVPFSWRPKMKKYLRKVTGPAGAFTTAFLVSLFLLPCTSGPYFVAGGILSNMSWASALPLLTVYNIIFVAPMLIILGAIYFGATEVEQINQWRKQNLEQLHLVTGVILILLGLFLIISGI